MINVSSHGFGACVLNLNGCGFVGNVAGGDGGVISTIWNQGTANIYFNRIIDNNANRGNAFYSKDTMDATIIGGVQTLQTSKH